MTEPSITVQALVTCSLFGRKTKNGCIFVTSDAAGYLKAGYLQIDKFGHAFGVYIESNFGYHWLRAAGIKQEQALLYGGTLGLVLQTPIEILDGLYECWGFS